MIIEQCVRQRLPLPTRIANSPELLFGLMVFYIAFMDLTSCRGTGYGTEGPISWLAVDEYADRRGFEAEQREDLHYFIGRLDSVYLNFKTEKLKDGSKIIGLDGKAMAR